MELQMQSYNTNYNNMVSSLGIVNKETVDGRSSRRRSSNSGKIERKIVEKNRRNQMKTLYSNLYCLLPHHSSKEVLSLPDQIDEAVNYIKSLEKRLKESRERKESLVNMIRKRSHSCIEPAERAAAAAGGLKPAEIRVEERGSSLEVALVSSGEDGELMFYEMIRILHEEGADVLNANFSAVGDTTFHVIHAHQIGANMLSGSVVATNIKEKLNKLVHGASNEQQLQQELWDFEIHDPETWDFPIM